MAHFEVQRRVVRPAQLAALACAALVAVLACEPGSVTEARDQLRRGGERSFQFVLPVSLDSLTMDEFLPETVDTIVDGIFGVNLVEQIVTVPVVDSFLVPVEFSDFDVDFGDFESAIRAAVINQAKVRIRFVNDSTQPVVLSNLTVGVVTLNPDGSVPVDASGKPTYELDQTGADRAVTITDPGDTAVTIAGQTTKILEFDAATVGDGVVNLVLDSVRAAVVLSGSGSGGGSPLNLLEARVRFVILLDLTLPPEGVMFQSDTVLDGAELDMDDATQIADRVELSTFTAVVQNATPFAVTVEFAFAEGGLPGVDVFTLPGAVLLDPVVVGGSAVDTNGLVITPTVDTVQISLTGEETLPLLRDQFRTAARVTLRGATGSGGRGVLGPAEVLVFDSRAEISIRTGGTP